MRNAMFGILAAGLLAGTGVSAASNAGARDTQLVLPDTPSGEGDPGDIVCRVPQKMPGSDAFGPKTCGYNSVWAQLTAHGKDLGADGKTVIDRPTIANPDGRGDPDVVACRTPREIPVGVLIRRKGPEICQSNRSWAKLIRDHKCISANGQVFIDQRVGVQDDAMCLQLDSNPDLR